MGGGFSAFAQKASAEITRSAPDQLAVREEKLASRLLGRNVPFRVLAPLDYDQKGSESARYDVIYLLHGLFGHFDNWTTKTSLARYAATYRFIIVMPEGGDGWYTDSVKVPSDKYESYIVKELIPEIDKRFRTFADRDHRVIAGLSMGGYGAIKFGLRHPEMFSLVGSFSGALDAPLRGQDGSTLWATLLPVYGPLGSTTRRQNDIFTLLRNAPDRATLPFIYLDCGTDDMFITTNREFDSLLIEKKIPHEYRELPGKHDWKYWDQQVQEFLRLASRRLVTSGVRNRIEEKFIPYS